VSFLFPSQTITFEAALRDVANGSPKARAMAAHALGDVTDPVEKRRAVDALVRALDDDRPEVRAEACASLGDLGEQSTLPHLVKRLGDGVPAVRQNAAIALGTFANPEAFEPLAEALRQGPADLRYQAATSLVEVDENRAFEPVVAALADKDPQVVGAAALSVGAIGKTDETKKAHALAALTSQLDHPDAGARFEVAYALAELGDGSGRRVLANSLADEARVLAAGKLLELDAEHAGARAVIIENLTNRKVHVRSLAIEQLTAVGGAWAFEPLQKLSRSSKGADLLEPIAGALRAIEKRS
jgi:HEAT repeat protein